MLVSDFDSDCVELEGLRHDVDVTGLFAHADEFFVVRDDVAGV